jgi:hypothetical protein
MVGRPNQFHICRLEFGGGLLSVVHKEPYDRPGSEVGAAVRRENFHKSTVRELKDDILRLLSIDNEVHHVLQEPDGLFKFSRSESQASQGLSRSLFTPRAEAYDS